MTGYVWIGQSTDPRITPKFLKNWMGGRDPLSLRRLEEAGGMGGSSQTEIRTLEFEVPLKHPSRDLHEGSVYRQTEPDAGQG